MPIDIEQFFDACDPNKTVIYDKEQAYYIDFASVRGGKIIESMKRTIARLGRSKPTCQLFTGHVGCGKSTELRRLEAELKEDQFYVVYFESTKDLDLIDIEITDILLAITYQISACLEKQLKIKLKPNYFVNLFREINNILTTPIEISDAKFSLPAGLGQITAQMKNEPNLRNRLRMFIASRITKIIESINKEVIEVAKKKLEKKGYKGLVVIVDELDRVAPQSQNERRSQAKYLFIDRGTQLRQLNCHVVYTIPLSLAFSNESALLTNRLGGGIAPKILPMVPVFSRSNQTHEEGMKLLQQMVMARAFPQETPEQRLNLIIEVFDQPETLDRLCQISGGHVRTLTGLLYDCLRGEDPPLFRECLERTIRDHRDNLVRGVEEDEWNLIHEAITNQNVSGEEKHQKLLRSLFIFEYKDDQGSWFRINPALAETPKYQSLIE